MDKIIDDFYGSEHAIRYYGWVVVGMGFLANLVGYGLVFAYGVFLKPVASEFGWSRAVTSGAFSSYAIVHNIMAFLAGRLIDRFSPKLVLTVAGFSLGLSMILMSFITSLWELYLYYGLVFSIGIAATYTPVMATVSRWFRYKRGLAIGVTAAGLGAGSLVFSPLVAWLISSFGWRVTYVIIGVISWVVFVPVVRFIRDAPREIGTSGSDSSNTLSFSKAFMTRTFWAFGVSWMFIAIAMWAIMIHIVPLATDRGMPIVTAGIMAGLIGVGSITGRIGAGFISDRVGRKKIIISAFSFQLIMTIWLLFSRQAWMFFLFAILFGLSSGGWTGVIAAFPADYFGLRATGTILGFSVIMAGIGIAIGPYLGGYFFDVTHSYEGMLVICIIATVAAILSASFITPVRKRDAPM